MARTGRPKKTVDVECVCIVCGTKFVIHEWQAKAGRGKLCSRPCYHASRRGQQLPSLRVEPKKKQCEFCGKEFLTGGFGRPRYSRRFCSQSCSTQFKYREGILKGGSKKGRMRNHQVGHFKYLNAERHLNHDRHGCVRPGLEPTEELTTWDIAWAAGIYEGEGHASLLKNPNGSIKTQHVGVGQKERWLCDRLRTLFGGYVTDGGTFQKDHFVGKVNYKGRHRGWSWNIHGPRARGFLMTIYKFLSPHRQARIKEVLA